MTAQRPMRAALAALMLMTACGGRPARVVLPNEGHDTTPLAKCHVSAEHNEPLVTEWPASSKARLEAMLPEGGVAVAYSGCELRIVDACRLPGTYTWRQTTLATDTTDIRDEDDLYAKLPLGAAALEGVLKSAGSLSVRTTVAGQRKLANASLVDLPNTAACAEATHIVTALSVGAFKLVAGGSAHAGASVGIGSVGAGGSSSQSESTVREAGDPASCEKTTSESPSAGCDSPIQIFLEPIPGRANGARALPAQASNTSSDSPPVPPPPPRDRTWGWITEGLGVASLGAGGYFIIAAVDTKSSIRNGGFATGGDIDSAASKSALQSNVGLAFVVGGVALAAYGLVALLSGPRHSTPPQDARATVTRAGPLASAAIEIAR